MKNKGFTYIELLITVTILSIVSVFRINSFNRNFANNEIIENIDFFHQTINNIPKGLGVTLIDYEIKLYPGMIYTYTINKSFKEYNFSILKDSTTKKDQFILKYNKPSKIYISNNNIIQQGLNLDEDEKKNINPNITICKNTSNAGELLCTLPNEGRFNILGSYKIFGIYDNKSLYSDTFVNYYQTFGEDSDINLYKIYTTNDDWSIKKSFNYITITDSIGSKKQIFDDENQKINEPITLEFIDKDDKIIKLTINDKIGI